MMRADVSARAALILLLVSRAASAGQPAVATPTARLTYVRGPGTEHCPDEDSVRNAVSSRLGYDAFEPNAATTVSVVVGRVGRALRVKIERRDDKGKVTGARELASVQNDCTELASAMTLAISIAIDPESFARPVEQEPLEPPPVAPPAAPPPCPPPPPAPPPDPVTYRASVGALASLGSAPAPAVGLTAQAGARWRNVSLGVEGRADFESSASVEPEGGVGTSLMLATLVPCMHSSVFIGCALASAGAMRGSGEDIDREGSDTTFFAAAGARAGAELPLSALVAARVHLDLVGVLTRTTLRISERRVWTTEPVFASLGVAGVLRF
jgi:hypothetical protein